jgi:hypothetical protein
VSASGEGSPTLLLIAWCVVGPCSGAIAFSIVFWLPVILGQPMEEMVGWGWITTIPAILAGIFCAGKACTLLLAKWSLQGAERSAFAVGAWIAGASLLAIVFFAQLIT